MLKIKFENLLVIFVLTIVTGYDTITTTMLNRTLPNIPVILLICVVLLLIFRFLYENVEIRQISIALPL